MWVSRRNYNRIRSERDIALRDMKKATKDDDFAYYQGLYEAYDMTLHMFAGKTPLIKRPLTTTQGD